MRSAFRYIIVTSFILLITIPLFVSGQQKQQIEILGANMLKIDSVGNQRVRKLVGAVKLKQDDVTLECDSAVFYVNVNAIDAYGHVHIFDNDMNAFSDSLKYDGDKDIATLYGNVKIIQDSITLRTNKLIYHTKTKVGKYFNGGKILTKDLTLTSKKGIYYSNLKEAYFKDSIYLKTNEYDIYTDTMRYNIDTRVSHFFGPTDIINPEREIYCESGWHNTNTGISVFGENTRLKSGSQKLFADSLYYDSKTDYGEAYKNFRWTDTSMNIILSGDKAIYYAKNQNITATDSALLIYIFDDDSLFLTADTLKSREDSIHNVTEFIAYYDVKIFKTNLQGLCDSLFYSFQDSIIRMYHDPILWNENNQLTGDTINISLKNDKLDQVELYENGFIVNEAMAGLYNQIKGKHIYGYFRNDKLDRLLVEGNGESVYYAADEEDAFIGMNKALCSRMWIYLKNQKVHRINFLAQPDATFYPIQKINPNNFLLEGFTWKATLRPGSRYDIFQ